MKEKELLLLRMVELMFEKQQTFLLIDELYEDDIIGTYIRNIQIDSPYQQLLFEGVLSQFSQGEELVVNITVENYFHHLLGLILQKDDRYQSSESIIELIKSNNLKGLKEGVSNLLGFDIEVVDFKRITDMIDLSEGDEAILEICMMPLVNSLLIHGVEKTIEVILENPTENDWKALFRLDSRLYDLQLQILRKDFLTKLMPHNQLQTKDEVWLGLKAITLFDKDESLKYLSKIDITLTFIQEEDDILFEFGRLEDNFGNYDKAIEYYEKSLVIKLKNTEENHPDIATGYNNLGVVRQSKGNYDKALEYLEKSLVIRLKNIGVNDISVATNYNNIGLVWYSKGNYNKAFESYEKSLEIRLKTFGENHTSVSTSYNNIGLVWHSRGNHDKALEYYKKCLAIRLKTFGENHASVSTSYNNIGGVWRLKGNYDKALEYYKKSLAINLKSVGENHSDVATNYNNIGYVLKLKGNYDKALEYYEKSLAINLKTIGENHINVATTYNHIGLVWKLKGNYDKALEYYEKCLSIELKTIGENHASVATSYNNIGGIWQSKGIYDIAILNFEKGYAIQKAGGFPFSIAQCYEELNDKENALDYYIQSATLRKERIGLDKESTQESISNALRLAKELDKENELPDWIKNTN